MKSEARPWEQPGAQLRDLEPDRGDLLQWLGWAGLANGLASLCLLFPALVAVPLGVMVLLMARHDLARMRAGLMDRAGEEQTQVARRNALCGLLIPLIPLLVLVGLLADPTSRGFRLAAPTFLRPASGQRR